MVLVPETSKKACCCFSSCRHAPAVVRGIHEFRKAGDKFFCVIHAEKVAKVLKGDYSK